MDGKELVVFVASVIRRVTKTNLTEMLLLPISFEDQGCSDSKMASNSDGPCETWAIRSKIGFLEEEAKN